MFGREHTCGIFDNSGGWLRLWSGCLLSGHGCCRGLIQNCFILLERLSHFRLQFIALLAMRATTRSSRCGTRGRIVIIVRRCRQSGIATGSRLHWLLGAGQFSCERLGVFCLSLVRSATV